MWFEYHKMVLWIFLYETVGIVVSIWHTYGNTFGTESNDLEAKQVSKSPVDAIGSSSNTLLDEVSLEEIGTQNNIL